MVFYINASLECNRDSESEILWNEPRHFHTEAGLENCVLQEHCVCTFLGGRLLVIYSAFSLCAGFSKISRGSKTTKFAPSNSIFSEIDWRLTKLAPSNRILLCKLIRVNTSELQNKAAIKIAWQVVRFLSFVFCWSLFRLSPWWQKPDQENLDTSM